MKTRVFFVAILGLFLGLGLGARASADDELQASSVKFVVLKDYSGKPVKNAAVVLHPVNAKGKQERGGIELKTDNDGRTNFEGVPYGPLRIQVLAPGFQTFGEDFEINQSEMEITVRLKRPGGQYSVYEEHPEQKKEEPKKDEAKKEETKKDQK